MSEETGIVVEIKEAGRALIKTERTTGCERCASKAICVPVSEREMVIEAINAIGAKPGEMVKVTIGSGTIIKAGALVYIVPLLGFIFGVLIGEGILSRIFPTWNAQVLSAATGFALLILTYVGVSVYSKTRERKNSYMPVITRVV